MTKEILILLDSVTLLFALIVSVLCIKLYCVSRSKAFVLIGIGYFWIIGIRVVWLIDTILRIADPPVLKDLLGSLALVHWTMLAIAFYYLYKTTNNIIHK